jgi:hypothetical protein
VQITYDYLSSGLIKGAASGAQGCRIKNRASEGGLPFEVPALHRLLAGGVQVESSEETHLNINIICPKGFEDRVDIWDGAPDAADASNADSAACERICGCWMEGQR